MLSTIRWEKFLERKFLLALGGVITGTLLAFGQAQPADFVDKFLGTVISVGMALGWIAAETSRDNVRDVVTGGAPKRKSTPDRAVANKTSLGQRKS